MHDWQSFPSGNLYKVFYVACLLKGRTVTVENICVKMRYDNAITSCPLKLFLFFISWRKYLEKKQEENEDGS